MDNLYSSLMGSFTNLLNNFGDSLAEGISETLKLQYVFPAILTLLIWIWTIKKIKDGEFAEFKTIVSLIIFIAYVGFSGWALSDPKNFMKRFNGVVKIPSEVLSAGITNAIAKTGTLSKIEQETGIDTLVNQEFHFISFMGKTIWNNFSIFRLGETALQIFLGTIAILIQLVYLCVLCIVIIMTTIQYYVWSGLAIFFIGLMFIAQTRGMVASYIKLLISLTLYQPALLLMASLNTGAINALIKITPTTAEINGNSIFDMSKTEAYEIIGIFTLISVVGIISILLLKFISKIIDSILGTQSDITGAGNISNMATKASTTIASMGAGAMAGGIMGMAKQAYAQKGGGIKGMANVGAALLTGGGSLAAQKGMDLVKKGISFGASKLGGGKK